MTLGKAKRYSGVYAAVYDLMEHHHFYFSSAVFFSMVDIYGKISVGIINYDIR